MKQVMKVQPFITRLNLIPLMLGYLIKFNDIRGGHDYQIKNYILYADLHMEEMQKKNINIDEVNNLRNGVAKR